MYVCTMQCLSVSVVQYRLAFQSLQNISADLPDWRTDVVSGMCNIVFIFLLMCESGCVLYVFLSLPVCVLSRVLTFRTW